MLGLVLKKRHEAALRSLAASAEMLHEENQAEIERLMKTVKNQVQALEELAANTKEAWARLNIVNAAKEEAESRIVSADERCKVAEAECARIMACHATRVRIGHIPIDPIEMTARARAVEGSIRCEWDLEKIVVYAGRPLTEAEYNATVAAIFPTFNRT